MGIKLTAKRRAALDDLVAVYQSSRERLQAELEGLRDEWQAEYDDKSERWQEGHAGTAAMDRMSLLEDMISLLDGDEINLESLSE